MTTAYTLAPTYNLDLAGAQQLESELEALDPVSRAEDEVRLDLTEVAFLASSGMRVMLKWAQQLDRNGKALVIANANEMVREVLTMSGFDTIIRVE